MSASPPTPTLADLETDWFARHYVDRTATLASLERALDQARLGPVVLWVHGVGGAGKTTLVRHWASQLGQRSGRASVVWIGLGGFAASPNSIDGVLEAALHDAGLTSLDGLGHNADPDVLVLDAVPSEGVLRWLIEARLARIGVHTLVVLTARTAPSVTLRTQLARFATLHTLALGDLDAAEVRAFFARRGVTVDDMTRLHPVCGGLPLVLELAALRAQSSDHHLRLDDIVATFDEVAPLLLEGCITEGRLPVLELLAVVRKADDALIESVLGREVALDARRWLPTLPVVSHDGGGHRLHQVLRELVFRDLVRDAPERYQSLLAAVVRALLDRFRSTTLEQRLDLLVDALHAGRHTPALRAMLPLPWYEALRLVALEGDRVARTADLIARHEGDDARAFFLAVTAQGLLRGHVLESLDGTITAVLATLDLEALDASGLAPLDILASTALDAHPPSARRDRVLARWFFSAETYQAFCPAMTAAMLSFIVAMRAQQPSGREVTFVVDEPARWSALNPAMNLSPLDLPAITLHGHSYGFFRGPIAADPAIEANAKLPALVGLTGPLAAITDTPAAGADGDGWVTAVRDALQSIGRAEVLAASPLAARTEGSTLDRAEQVRTRIREGIERLAQSRDYLPAVELLRVTYLDPGMKHEAAAHALKLPYGTYRYRHRRAVSLLAQAMAE